jgi:formylglycine-generating enzyme required for sulfatase activity
MRLDLSSNRLKIQALLSSIAAILWPITRRLVIMRKSVVFLLIVMITAMLSGCIISKTPSTNNFTMKVGEQKTFSVDAFPFNGTYAWNLDEVPLSNMGNSIVYTAKVGKHSLTVRATHALFIDKQTWNITCDPTIDLLNSMVYIPGGTFMMGSTDNWNGWAQYTTPVHQVTLSGFYMGAYEVTQAQYLAVMGE